MSDGHAVWKVELSPAALRELRRLDGPVRRRVVAAIDALAVVQRPAGVRALVGYPGQLRIRVGDYRIVYEVHDDRLVVFVIAVGHRGEAYRHL